MLFRKTFTYNELRSFFLHFSQVLMSFLHHKELSITS